MVPAHECHNHFGARQGLQERCPKEQRSLEGELSWFVNRLTYNARHLAYH